MILRTLYSFDKDITRVSFDHPLTRNYNCIRSLLMVETSKICLRLLQPIVFVISSLSLRFIEINYIVTGHAVGDT